MRKVKLRYFGRLSEIIGSDNEIVELKHDKTLGILNAELQLKYPGLSKVHYLIFVNSTKATNLDIKINNTDEISFMPPFSGG
ncbi:MAG: MoaD/ThiS family protein [Bacteroidales bacterium]|nr:MoaD/ThiS family protein [Bacteroidales bacterium]MBN2818400.1 MoaD/ThiS family protein [Bacteroidales bacterium]